MLHLVSPHRICGPSGNCVVQHMAVGPGHDGGVVCRFGPSLNLQAVHPGVYKVGKMVYHAHIPGVKDVCAPLILKNREIFTGALFLHKCILVAAGLGAGAPVGVAPGHVVRQQAPPGIGHAHSPVAKGLQLQLRRYPLPYGAYLLQAQFPGQDHTGGPQVIPGLSADVVGHRLLGADVPLAMGGVPPCQGKSA